MKELPQNTSEITYKHSKNYLLKEIYKNLRNIIQESNEEYIGSGWDDNSSQIDIIKIRPSIKKTNLIGYAYMHKQNPLKIGSLMIDGYEKANFEEKWILKINGHENIESLTKVIKEGIEFVEENIINPKKEKITKKISLEVILDKEYARETQI